MVKLETASIIAVNLLLEFDLGQSISNLDSIRPVLNDRRDTGTSPLRHASSPSVGRSVADVLSAHGLRGEVPASQLGLWILTEEYFLGDSIRI